MRPCIIGRPVRPGKQISTTIEVDMEEITDEDHEGIQTSLVFLYKITVVLVSSALELIVELDADAASRPVERRC